MSMSSIRTPKRSTRGKCSPRRALAALSLEHLETRQLMAVDTLFIGVTAPQGVSQIQNLVTFDSNAPTAFTTVGPLTGVPSGSVIEALSRSPVSNTTYGFAVDTVSLAGQVYRIDTKTAVATPLSVPYGNYGAAPNGFYADSNGNEQAYSGTYDVTYNPQGIVIATNDTRGRGAGPIPVTQAVDTHGFPGGLPAWGLTTTQLTETMDGLYFSNGSTLSQPFSSAVGLQIAAPIYPSTAFVTGSILGAGAVSEYDLFNVNLGDGTVTKLATLPTPLYGFTNLVLPDHFTVTGIPSPVAAGTAETITVTLYYNDGTVDTGYTGTVHLTSNDGNAVLGADAMLTNGVGTFDVTLKTAGTDSVTATDTVTASLTGIESNIQVTPAFATRFNIAPVVNMPGSFTVRALDAYGNVATGYPGTVHITSSDPAAGLPPDAMLTNGVGVFHVTLVTPGTHSITATDTMNAEVTGTETGVSTPPMTQGTVSLDSNASGSPDSGELGLAGRVVFVDLNHDGILDSGDPTTTTDANGHFAFPGVAPGSAPVLEATSQDTDNRYVVDQIKTNPDGTVSIGVVPISAVAPVPVVPNPFSMSPNPDANVAYVQSLYHAVLGRTGGDGEAADWIARLNSGMTHRKVSEGFVNSTEHRRNQVDAYYQKFLHRASDSGVIDWVNKLLSGVSEEVVVQGFLDSPEYQAAHQDQSLFVRDLYLDVLSRQGESTGTAAAQASLASGMSRQAVEAYFVDSSEAIGQIVGSFYTAYLHRQPEQGTSNTWGTMLAAPNGSATDVATGMLSSVEFAQNAMNPRS